MRKVKWGVWLVLGALAARAQDGMDYPVRPLPCTSVQLGAGFWRVYRRSACDGPACAKPAPNRWVKAALWGAAVLVGVAVAFPYVAPLLLS